MKITLTSAQITEIRTKVQAEQQAAYEAYLKARDKYNKVLEGTKSGQIELADLLALTQELPDEPVKVVKPFTVDPVDRFFAWTRTGRKEANGKKAMHDIAVSRRTHKPVSCTCPGFANHGYCWASDEAATQSASASRPNGTQGVFRRWA